MLFSVEFKTKINFNQMNSEKFIFFALALITIFPLLHVIGESNKDKFTEVKKITDGVYKFGGAIINQN